MARVKPTLAPLHELTPDQYADCFVQLIEKKHGTTREGKPFYTCRFSDAQRIATSMVWADSPLFAACENEWQEGQFFKIRGTYAQHERFGPQLELETRDAAEHVALVLRRHEERNLQRHRGRAGRFSELR